MAKDAYYFSHDSNAHNDTKILSMVCDYGMKGYGMFWVVVENLREQGEYKLKHEKSTWKALSMQVQCTVDEVKKFIEDCIYEYALFDMAEDLYFYSNSLNRRMDKYQNIKSKRVEAANKRWANTMQTESKTHANALQKDAKEMKLNEMKGNKNNNKGTSPTFKPPALEEVQAYCKERNNKVDAEQWHNFYLSKAWMIGKNKMKDWKAAVRTWEPDEKPKEKSKYQDLSNYRPGD